MGKNVWLVIGAVVIAVGGYLVISSYYSPTDNPSEENVPDDTAPVEGMLLGSDWSWQYTDLAQGGRMEAPSGDKFILSFDRSASQMMSTTDCNSLSGNYVIDGEVLSFGDFTSTLMFCENSVETEYAGQLRLVNSYSIGEDNLRLNLARGAGVMVFRRR